MTDNLPKAPALDGYPDLMRRLLTLNFKDYAKILDSPGFPFNTNQQLEEQSRMFAVTQVSGKPWWISKLPALASSSSSLVVYLFSSFNSIYDTPARALSLADCLFKTCTFGNSGSTSLENRIREAISEQFRWMYFGIKVEPQVDGPFWNLTTSTGDESYPLLAAIELLLELGFLDSSLPIILRLCLNQIEGLEDHLSDLQETLLTRFHGKVICTPAHHQSATLESLRFKVGI